MKVSEITVNDVADYIKIDSEELEEERNILEAILEAAKTYIAEYTGIPKTSDNETDETLDSHEDFWIVVMVLCQDMHDNRSMYVDKSNVNKVVETILGMHCKNLL